MTLSLNTLTHDTPLFADLMSARSAPLPEFDPWDPTYVPKFEGLQKPVNDLQQALGAFDNGGIALGETALDIAAEIEAFHLHALQELGLTLPRSFLVDPHAPRTALEWFAHARATLAEAAAVIDPAELQAAVVISDIDSSSMIIVARPAEPPAPIEVQSERLDGTPAAEPVQEHADEHVTVLPDTAGTSVMPQAFIEHLREQAAASAPSPTLHYSARDALDGLITAEAIKDGVAKISVPVADAGTPVQKPSPVPRKRGGRRRRSHEAVEACTGTGLCKTGCIVQPPQTAEEPLAAELPPIPPELTPALSDAEMDTLLDIPIRFWVCPEPAHHDLRDEQGDILATVEWRGEVAYCLASQCGRSSADGEASDTA